MIAILLSALIGLIVGFTHKKRGEALLVEAETETSVELATALRQKSEKELRKSRFWFIFSGVAFCLALVFLIILASA